MKSVDVPGLVKVSPLWAQPTGSDLGCIFKDHKQQYRYLERKFSHKLKARPRRRASDTSR
eukprot:6211369-Pleurochrysis_carterae.AAC.4